jgi:UPF0716 protein FxsA
MFFRLLLVFTAVPFVELYLLLEIGSRIGLWATLALVLFTGVAGATLARWQGFAVLSSIHASLERGELPGNELIDGVLVLAGGLLLLTPGFLTDTAGFLLILPFSRSLFREWLKDRFRRRLDIRPMS